MNLTDAQCIQRFQLDREAILNYTCADVWMNNFQDTVIIHNHPSSVLSVPASGSFQRVTDMMHTYLHRREGVTSLLNV